MVSKKTPSSRSCSATSIAQPAKPWPPSGWSEAPAGIAYGLPPAAMHVRERLLPARLEPDPEAGRVEADVRAHEAAHQDVARAVVRDVRPLHPVLLDEHALQARVRSDSRDLAGVVGLDAADGDERVAALGDRVREEVLQLAHLVAAEGEAAVAVLALGPDRRAAEVPREAVQPLDGRRAEQQRGPGEVGERHGQAPTIVVAAVDRNATVGGRLDPHKRAPIVRAYPDVRHPRRGDP